jgi:hypothetical protein
MRVIEVRTTHQADIAASVLFRVGHSASSLTSIALLHHLRLTTARLRRLAGGDGALANVALDRALADNWRYSMARLLRQAIDPGRRR